MTDYDVIFNGVNDGQDGDLLHPVDWTSPKSPDVPMNLRRTAGRPHGTSRRDRRRRYLRQEEYAAMRARLAS